MKIPPAVNGVCAVVLAGFTIFDISQGNFGFAAMAFVGAALNGLVYWACSKVAKIDAPR